MTHRVLLVDDAHDVRLLQRVVLEEAGFEVSEAPSGADALAHLSGCRMPDVVVLDVQMPDLDGWATLEAIRADERTAPVPVILCTVKAGDRDGARAWGSGCDGYLVKPFSIARLVEEVRDVLGRSAEEREALRRVRTAAYGPKGQADG
ncbi:MAG TPA: response regulator [Acidimicrobiales bacterium]|nr:response regulator [Acidimicrobiales bacterium]